MALPSTIITTDALASGTNWGANPLSGGTLADFASGAITRSGGYSGNAGTHFSAQVIPSAKGLIGGFRAVRPYSGNTCWMGFIDSTAGSGAGMCLSMYYDSGGTDFLAVRAITSGAVSGSTLGGNYTGSTIGTNDNLAIEWDGTNFAVYLATSDGGAYSNIFTRTTGNGITAPSGSYYFFVAFEGASGAPTWDNFFGATTDGPSAASSLSASDSGSLESSLGFSVPNEADITHYLVRYKSSTGQSFTDETDGTEYAAETSTTPNASVTGATDTLPAAGGYTLGVFVKDYWGYYSPAATTNVTLADDVAPSAPASLSASATGSDSITTGATMPSDADTAFNYVRYKAGSSQSFTDETDGTLVRAQTATTPSAAVSGVTLGGLSPSTAYTIAWFAEDGDSNVSTAATVNVTTDAAAASGDLTSPLLTLGVA